MFPIYINISQVHNAPHDRLEAARIPCPSLAFSHCSNFVCIITFTLNIKWITLELFVLHERTRGCWCPHSLSAPSLSWQSVMAEEEVAGVQASRGAATGLGGTESLSSSFRSSSSSESTRTISSATAASLSLGSYIHHSFSINMWSNDSQII